MAILGNLIRHGIILRESIEQQFSNPSELQRNELRKLLIAARNTEFGREYAFRDILKSFKDQPLNQFFNVFKQNIPVFTYDEMHERWWHRTTGGEKNVCWPGKIRFFALSSGTSGASSKYIPITGEQIRAIRKTSIRQLLTLSRYPLPSELFTTGVLLLGGSTQLNYNGTFFEGDLSGITAKHIPFWFQRFYKPGQKIAKNIDWGDKLDEITRKASNWNIGIIAGVPAWVQILLEKIVRYYKVDTIHDIWPDFTIFVHGGVSIQPYKKTFERLLKKPLIYIETYLASEGFLAFQSRPHPDGMKLVLNNGIFFEFIPFDDQNFNENGDLKDNPETLMIHEIEENKDYALLISTCAGAWRYLIGDTVKLADARESEIIITGRTKHFLSLCGEHMSVDNMNQVIRMVNDEMNLDINEYSVSGEQSDSLFAHKWYIGTERSIEANIICEKIDTFMKKLNDDYRTERKHALRDVKIEILPNKTFYDFLKMQGKEGGQNKFPRVLKGDKLHAWKQFLQND